MKGAIVLAVLAVGLPASATGQLDPTPLVVIDAGHGGPDPGASGRGGLREKDVALDVALRLADLLARDGFDVRLTRATDFLVPLHERASMANGWRDAGEPERPALFLSIHANAHESPSVRGVETYFLAEPLTDEARQLAAFENSARRFEPPAPEEVGLAFILDDLRQNLYLRESSTAASIFQQSVLRVHPGPDRGVKQARFVVLSGVRMPGVLVEIGFITNARDEGLLGSQEHGSRVAHELRQAVADYFAGSALGRTATID